MNPKNSGRIHGTPDEWLSHAESDLRLARLATEDDSIYLDQICFHTQQAAEKAIKAVLLFRNIEFPLTHDIEVLLELTENSGIILPTPVQNAGLLTPYAVETRYPGSWMEIAETDVEEAIYIAEETCQWARRMLTE